MRSRQDNTEQSALLIDIATRNVLVLAPADSIGKAAHIMAENKISSILVTDTDGHPLGIVTESNILHAMLSKSPQSTALQQIMSSPVITVADTMSCLDAYQASLRDGIRHMVIVDDEKRLLGVVSDTDFRLHFNLTALAGRRKVVAIAKRSAVILPPSTNLMQALDLMQVQHKSCVVVVENEKPVGIITERDVVRFYSGDISYADISLGEVMVSPILTILSEATTNQAAEKMLANRVRHLVVVDDSGRLVGLLSEHDLTQAMLIGLAEERDGIEENFLRTLINTIPDLVWLKDVNGIYMACNSRFELFYGAKEQDIVGKTDYDFVDKEQADFFRAHDRKAMEACQSSVNEEWLTFAASGYRGLFETIKTPMRDNKGTVIGVLGVARDITEHIAAKMSLQQLTDNLTATLQAIPDLMFELDQSGKYIDIWARNPELLAAQKELLLGKVVGEMLPRDAADIVMSALREAEEKGYSHGQIIRLDLPQGEAWFELSTSIKASGDATDKRFLMMSRDITERIKAEEMLRKLSAAVEQSSASVVITDLEARIQYVNPHFTENTGYSAAEVIGQNPRIFQSGQTSKNTHLEMWSKLTSGQAWNGELYNKRKNGELYWEDVRIAPVKNPQGVVTHYVGVKTDITENKRAESMLRESEVKYRQLFETAGDGIFIQNANGFIDCNEKGASMYGLTRAQLIGRHPSELAPERQPDGRLSSQVAGELIPEALGGKLQQFEWQALHADGSTLEVEITLSRTELNGEVCLQAVVRDISARKKAENALRESEEKLRNLYELSPLGIALADMSGRYVEFNESFRRICGYTRDELNKLDYWTLTPKKYEADEVRQLESLASIGRYGPYEKEYVRKDGNVVPLRLNGVLVTGRDGKKYIWSIVEDITESKRAEENLGVIASVFDNTQEAIIITDAKNTIIEVNSAFTAITGYSRDEVLGKNPKILNSGRQDKTFYAGMWSALTKTKAWRGEMWNRRKSGEVYAEMLSISVICDEAGNIQRHVGVFSDITYFKNHEAELSRIANYDALTGLPNRRLLADRLRQAIAHAQRNCKMLAICFLDLDGFKNVNDQYGHEAGDRLLVDISRRLLEMLRAGDTLARLGGDEFVVLFNDLAREQECFQVLDRILDIIGMPVDVGGGLAKVSASIGVTFYPAENVDGDTLLRHADQAMYVAKQTGKNRYHLYDSVQDQRIRSLYESRKHILQGLKSGEFELYYQPKIDLVSGTVVGVEALIRWHHTERGLLLPAEFLPLIEDSDLEIQLGEWVMDAAMAQLDSWCKDGLALEISINISARHLQSPEFASRLDYKLSQYPNLQRDKLQIEVLETAALEDIAHSSDTIDACRRLGVNFALDDFGTGYSSLAYLRKLSAETLKIDQSFVRGMLTDEGDRAIVQGIIALAKTFGRKTVAEGIEAAELTQVLVEIGCMYGQGYGIAHPMSEQDFLKWHRERK